MTIAAICASFVSSAQSLYDPNTFRPLTADNKAFRVGDIVTVQVIESATAAANADTGSRRTNSLRAGVAPALADAATVGLEVGGEFDGGGRTARAGKLLAQLSVTVKVILPNGDLHLEGEQMLVINDEQQRINLVGRVRPQDISEGNVVLSSRLADARITYLGEGDLAERQKPAWWRRLLDTLGF